MSDWLVPYLVFNGNCEEAVNFYQAALGGESQIMHFSDAPPNPAFPIPEQAKNLVIHAELRKNGHVIRFSDTFPGSPYTVGNNVSFSIEFDTTEETSKMFKALSVGGTIEMELQETFFSPLFSKFIDKFGITWMVSCKK